MYIPIPIPVSKNQILPTPILKLIIYLKVILERNSVNTNFMKLNQQTVTSHVSILLKKIRVVDPCNCNTYKQPQPANHR